MEPQDNNRELIGQLKQMNTQLMAQLATASQLVSSVLGTVYRRAGCHVSVLMPSPLRLFHLQTVKFNFQVEMRATSPLPDSGTP